MKKFREYELPADIVEQAHALGIFGSIQRRIQRMARLSAPFKHPYGNRRYEEFVLRIEDEKLLFIGFVDGLPPTKVANAVPVFSVCPDCDDDGDYCATCDTTGKVLED